jgi:DNA-binding protein H-NS
MRTVVAWFGNLSFDQQKDALGQMQQAHEQARGKRRAELAAELASLGYGAANSGKRRGRPARARSTNGAGFRLKAKVKYRDPKTSETWSGRGRMARWLSAKQAAGERIEKYLVKE